MTPSRHAPLAALALATLALSACTVGPQGIPTALPFGGDPPFTPGPRTGEQTVAMGTAAKYDYLSLTPVAIVEDSRCPYGAQCFQAGRARVSTTVVSRGVMDMSTLTLGEPRLLAGRSVTLVGLCPSPLLKYAVLPRTPTVTYRVTEPGESAAVFEGCPTDPAPRPRTPVERALDRINPFD